MTASIAAWTGKKLGSHQYRLDRHNRFRPGIDPETPTTLYAGTRGGGVFKSVNAGIQWTPVKTGLTSGYVNFLVIDPSMPSILYVGAGSYLFKSTNGAESWSEVKVKTSTSYMPGGIAALAIHRED